jgi:DNA-directed RNA polymerase subunit N (RpoN/RPB10)
MLSEFICLVCGLYVGKYYSEYVPLPRIRQEHIDALLAYLKKQATPLAQQPTHTE